MHTDLSPFARWARAQEASYARLAADLETLAVASGHIAPAEPLATVDETQVQGKRQREIVRLPELAKEDGLKTAEIAERIDYEVPNTHTALRALETAGIVELVPHSSPQRWRLSARYRDTSGLYMAMAQHVHAGEWATYGDIAVAARGEKRFARVVGQAALTLPEFPNPHRILMQGKKGGYPYKHWCTDYSKDADVCRQLLKEEGVRFLPNGEADPAQRVTWEELEERAR